MLGFSCVIIGFSYVPPQLGFCFLMAFFCGGLHFVYLPGALPPAIEITPLWGLDFS